jgi:phenylpyruvate tautomerase PptA (4-oxalocrotonate tautomerase family)
MIMPFLKIQSNSEIPKPQELISKASALISQILGKPEKFIMVSVELNPDMIFGGINDPLLYIELKSIGLPRDRTKEISSKLCSFFNQETEVAIERMYIEFSDAERSMWGWNGTTFER